MKWMFFGSLACSLAVFACAETQTNNNKDGGGSGSDAQAPTDGGGTIDSSNYVDAGPFDAAQVQGLVFNELSGTGGDWVELHNTGSAPVDLTNIAISDNDKDSGGPKLSEALVFKPGTMIPPGGYLVIVANEKPASADPKPCFDGGVPSGCPIVTWGISKDEPNKLFILDPDKKPLLQVDMPGNAHQSGESYSRLPNGTGMFGVGKPTPGSANMPK